MPVMSIRYMALMAMFLLVLVPVPAYATFSIVAVDTATGTVGSAGASCIAGAEIIHSCIENIGAVNTQAYYIEANQDHADSLMLLGLEPDSIISWLINNDAQGLPQRRQYGVVTLAGPGTSAAFTGSDNTDYKGHRTGPAYSIQGNILLGPQILDDMQTAFLSTPGPLEDKLMAALEAADVIGADTRCFLCNKPAISAFIKVVHIGDGDTPYLYEFVHNTPCEENPIPQLRDKYDAWKLAQIAHPDSTVAFIEPDIVSTGASATVTIIPLNSLGEPLTHGATVSIVNSGEGTVGEIIDNGNGVYTAAVSAPSVPGSDTLHVSIEAGGQLVEVSSEPVIDYFICGDVEQSGAVDIDDIVFLIGYLFSGPPEPVPYESSDVNCASSFDIDDIVYLIAYVFSGGPPPCDSDGDGVPDC